MQFRCLIAGVVILGVGNVFCRILDTLFKLGTVQLVPGQHIQITPPALGAD